MQHVENVGGIEHMEVDHFDPGQKKEYIQSYDNLFLAKSACNNKKQANWPSVAEQKLGIRFLNPCKEQDYGVHIFEDPETHIVWGVTPAGKYHVRILGLNSDNLVKEREARSKLQEMLNKGYVFNKTDQYLLDVVQVMQARLERSIPMIPCRKQPE